MPVTLERKIRALVRRIAPDVEDEFGASADLYREVGLKSIAALDLLLSLEEELGVSIEDESFGEARSVDKLVALVGGLLAGSMGA